MTPLSYYSVSRRVSASIGPNAQWEIPNLELAPVVSAARSFLVVSLQDVVLTHSRRTVLANGAFPGPLIQGNKVSAISELTL